MALRDDLKKEVEEIQAKQRDEEARHKADQEYYLEHLKPAMQRALQYFNEVVANLVIVSPKVNPKYPLNPTLKNGVALNQSEYKFRTDDGKNPREIDVLCVAKLDRPMDFFVNSKEGADKHAALLNRYDFAHHRKNYLDRHYNVRGATFYLEGPMRVYFRIIASAADRCVYIDFRNLEDQPSNRYSFAPEQLDESLCDQLSYVLLRKEPYLIPPKVGEVARGELRRQIDIETQRKEEDLADAYQEREANRKAEQDALLVNRTKRAFFKGSKDAIDILKRQLNRTKSNSNPEPDSTSEN